MCTCKYKHQNENGSTGKNIKLCRTEVFWKSQSLLHVLLACWVYLFWVFSHSQVWNKSEDHCGLWFQPAWVCHSVHSVDSNSDCPDGSDELCDDSCIPNSFTGKYTMKVGLLVSPFPTQGLSIISYNKFWFFEHAKQEWFFFSFVMKIKASAFLYSGGVMANVTALKAQMKQNVPVGTLVWQRWKHCSTTLHAFQFLGNVLQLMMCYP